MKSKAVIGELTLQFNPETLRERREVEYNKIPIKGLDVTPIEFKSGSGKRFDLPVFLDGPTSGKGNSIEDRIKTLDSYAKKDESSGAPPVVDFVYGDELIPVAILAVEIVDKFRDPDDATRTRALITLTLQEFRKHEYHRTVREDKGDRVYISGPRSTFRSIALLSYANGDLENVIIARNHRVMLEMVGPIIPPGKTIIIPAWSIAEQYLPENESVGLVKYA